MYLSVYSIGFSGAESLATSLKTNTTLKKLILGHGYDISKSVYKKIYDELGKRIRC